MTCINDNINFVSMNQAEHKAFQDWLIHQPEYQKILRRWAVVRVIRLGIVNINKLINNKQNGKV